MLRWLSLALLTLVACPGGITRGPFPPIDVGPGSDGCEEACAQLDRLQCPGMPTTTPGGTPCVQVCRDVESSGVGRFCPRQLARARTCEEASQAWEACE